MIICIGSTEEQHTRDTRSVVEWIILHGNHGTGQCSQGQQNPQSSGYKVSELLQNISRLLDIVILFFIR